MEKVTAEELGRFIIIGALVLAGLAALIRAGLWLLRQIVTRHEFDALKADVQKLTDEVRRHGEVPPQVEEQLRKMVDQLRQLTEALQKRK